MLILFVSALAVLPQVASGISPLTRYEAWQWQRVIQPAAGAPADEQCVVLDADLYASAAPGLRDVRLLQDGREVAYALQESYDEPTLHGTRGGDRSLYTTVLKIPLQKVGRLQEGTGVLQQHVPVERVKLFLRLEGPLTNPAEAHRSLSPVHIRLVATPSAGDAASPRRATDSEIIEDDLNGDRPVELTAIGANLQRSARIDLAVDPGEQQFAGALLQMHQRSLCYKPFGSAPLLLLFGNAAAPLVRYAYAAHYQPKSETPLASLSPVQRNGNYQPKADRALTLTRRQRRGLAVCVAVAGFLLTSIALLRSR